MYARKIEYVDYNGTKREETFYFNLSKAEVIQMELGVNGGLTKMLENMVEAEDGSGLSKFFNEIILKSYGEKSLDGKRFIKSKELSEAFSQTEAYSELYLELVTDAGKASEFVKGIMPKEAVQAVEDHNKPALGMTTVSE